MDRSSFRIKGGAATVRLRINERAAVESLNGVIAVTGIITEEGNQTITGAKSFDVNTLFKGGLTIGSGSSKQHLTISRELASIVHEIVSSIEDGSGDWYTELLKDGTSVGKLKITASTGLLEYNGQLVWHEGNDGHGSTLNADLLDGLHASELALADHTHNSLSDGTAVFTIPTKGAGAYELVTADDISGYLPLSGGVLIGDTAFQYGSSLFFKAGDGSNVGSIVQNVGALEISSGEVNLLASISSLIKSPAINFNYSAAAVFRHDISGDASSFANYSLPLKAAGDYILATKGELDVIEGLYLPLSGGTLSGDLGINTGVTVPQANIHIKGKGSSNATSALKVENNAGAISLEVKDDGSLHTSSINLPFSGIIKWPEAAGVGLKLTYSEASGAEILSNYGLNINSTNVLTMGGDTITRIEPKSGNASSYFEVLYPNIDFVQEGIRFNLPKDKTTNQTLATLEDLTQGVGDYLPLSGGTMIGDILMGGASEINFTTSGLIKATNKLSLSAVDIEVVKGSDTFFQVPVKTAGTYTFATIEDFDGLVDGYLPLTGGIITSPGVNNTTSSLVVKNSTGLIGLDIKDDGNISLGKNIIYTDASGVKMRVTNQTVSIGSDYQKPQISFFSQNFGNEIYNIHSNANTTKHILKHSSVTPELQFSLFKGTEEQMYRLPTNKSVGTHTLATLGDIGFEEKTAAPTLVFDKNYDWSYKTTNVGETINVNLDLTGVHEHGKQIILKLEGTGDNPVNFSGDFKMYGWENGAIATSARNFHIIYYDNTDIAVIYWPGLGFSIHDHDELYLKLSGGTLTGPLTIGEYTLPLVDGLSGQVLSTNGVGVLSWGNTYPSGTNGQILVYNAEGVTIPVTPNTAHNKNFGDTAGSVAEGNKFLKLSGGILTGNLSMNNATINISKDGIVEGKLENILDADNIINTVLSGNKKVQVTAGSTLSLNGKSVLLKSGTNTHTDYVQVVSPVITFREKYDGNELSTYNREFILPNKLNGRYVIATVDDILFPEDIFPTGTVGQLLQYNGDGEVIAINGNTGFNLPLGNTTGTVAEGNHTHTSLTDGVSLFNIPSKAANNYTLATIEDINLIDSLPAGTQGQLIIYDADNKPASVSDPYKKDMTRALVRDEYKYTFLSNNDTLIIDAQWVRTGFFNVSVANNIYPNIYLEIRNIPIGARYSVAIEDMNNNQTLFAEMMDPLDGTLKFGKIPASPSYMLLEYNNTNGHTWDSTWRIVNEDYTIYRYLRLTGGTLSGDLNMSNDRDIILPGGSSIRNDTAVSDILFLESTEIQLSVNEQSIFTVLTDGRLNLSRNFSEVNESYQPSINFQQGSDISGTIAVGAQGGDASSIALTANRKYYMPNKSGVVALLSDITGGGASVFNYSDNGLVPAPGGSGATRYLREDGAWEIPAGGGGSYTLITDVEVDNNTSTDARLISGERLNSWAGRKGFLTSFTETDPIFNASPAKGITGTNITNWNSAFSWGNHASEGYLKSFTETDPVFVAHPTFNITGTKITNWDNAFSWGNHASAGYIKSFSETDPIFTAHAAYGVTSTKITNWDNAFSWGDHGLEGYLKSFTESDPIFRASPAGGISGSNIMNWNNAFSWGNHASAGYLKTLPIHDHNHLYLKLTGGTLTGTLTIGSYTLPTGDGANGQVLITNGSGTLTWGTVSSGSTTYGVFSRGNSGLVPAPGGTGTTRFLREDGTWYVPAQNNSTYSIISDAEADSVISTAARLISGERLNSWAGRKGFLTSFTETDPIFNASPAKGITGTNITNWNSAFSWGNHASEGYLKSFTETDPVFVAHPTFNITGTKITNWDNAFSWGNHAGLYALVGHNHNGVYEPAFTKNSAFNKDFGNSGGNVPAISDLGLGINKVVVTDSVAKLVTETKADAFNKPFGTTPNTVAMGNHTHSGYAASNHQHDELYVNITGDVMTGNLSVPQLISNASQGTPPLAVTSNTVVSNLNADMVDGLHSGNLFQLNSSRNGNLQFGSGSNYGIRFWGSDQYKINMSSTSDTTWGGQVAGAATSDYNMYFRMSGGTNRGFVFLNGTTGITQIESNGTLRVGGELYAYQNKVWHAGNLSKTEFEPANSNIQAHITATNNPHNTTKSHVGLGSVNNWGIATTAEAQVGTANNKYMTPLRVKEAITALSAAQSVTSVNNKTGAVVLNANDVGAEPAFGKNSAFNKNFGNSAGNVPAISSLGMGINNVVVTDESAKLRTEAKSDAFNKPFGTSSGTVAMGNHTHGQYLTSFTESDPTVPSHVKSITGGNINNWNAAYSWGNHAGLYSAAGHTHNYDNYQSWNLRTNGTQRTTVTSGGVLDLRAGTNMGISYGAGGVVTFNATSSGTTYTHPAKTWVNKSNLSGATVISNLTIDALGHPTNWVTRSLTAGDIGALGVSQKATDSDRLDGLNYTSFWRTDTGNAYDLRVASGDGRGLRFWDNDTYKIYMSSTANTGLGGRLDTTSDYNMYFRMGGGTNRGFVFQNGSTPVAQIDGGGKFSISNGSHRVLINPSFGPPITQITTTAQLFDFNKSLYVFGNITATGEMKAQDFMLTSDIRLKENIKPIENASEKVNTIETFYHTWVDKKETPETLGVSAQQIKEVVPQVVSYDEKEDIYRVSYGKLVPLLIEAHKEQSRRLEERDIIIKQLMERMDKLERNCK